MRGQKKNGALFLSHHKDLLLRPRQPDGWRGLFFWGGEAKSKITNPIDHQSYISVQPVQYAGKKKVHLPRIFWQMTNPPVFSSQILEDIRQGKREAVKVLYGQAFHYSTGFVLKNNGTTEEAREVFQEALFVLVKNAREEHFKLTHDVRTYLYSICRNLWLKELRRRRNSPILATEEILDIQLVGLAENGLEEKPEMEAIHRGLEDCMKKLSPKNRQLLRLTFFEKLKDRDIAPQMEISFKFVRQKRQRCIAMLRKCMEAS